MKVYNYDETTKVLDITIPLVTVAEVRLICKEVEDEGTDEEISLFILTAHQLVCEYVDGYSIPSTLLASIERYLSAHFTAVTYTPTVFESAGKVQASYSTKVALGFDLTRYGQQAVRMDATGNLKKRDSAKRTTAMISWLGMTCEERRNAYANT